MATDLEENKINEEDRVTEAVSKARGKRIQRVRGRKGSGILTFFSALLILCLIVVGVCFFVIVPQINKTLNQLGIKDLKEFITFYRELNNYVDEGDIITHPYTQSLTDEVSDYTLAYNALTNVGLKIFESDSEVSNVNPEKFDSLDFSSFESAVYVDLTDKQMASLLNNALNNNNFLETLGINIIEEYDVGLEIKQIHLKANSDGSFNMVAVFKANLSEFSYNMPWPFNGVLPNTIYMVTEGKFSLNADGSANFESYKINVNDMSPASQQVAVNVVNSLIENEDIEQVTLDGLAEKMNKLIYDKIAQFAEKLHSNLSVVNSAGGPLFRLSYAENSNT